MFGELNERLAELHARKRQKEHAERRLEAIRHELEEAERKRDELERAWQRERRDVERLRKPGFGALLLALAGKRKERLTKEEEDMLRTKRRLEEAEEAVNNLLAERDGLKRLLWKLSDVDAKIAAILAEKERAIRAHHPGLAAELDEVTRLEAEEDARAKQLQEAVAAGKKALRELERAENHLRSARNWGVYDMMGGGIVSTAVKHRRIDEARSAFHAARTALQRFRKELEDAARGAQLDLRPDPILKIGDYLLDGLIFDWAVQGKIKEALEQTRRESARVRRIVAELEEAARKSRSQLDALRRRKETLVRDV